MKLNLIHNKALKIGLLVLACVVLSACETLKGGVEERGESKLSARARSHTELGAAYFQQNKLEIALDEFKYAVEIDPEYAQAYNGLGLVYAALGEDAKADGNFKKAIQVEPRNSESHNNYGSFLCARKRYDESITHFLEAVKNPLYATPNLAYANAGICSIRKNDTKNAEIYLSKALQIEPLTHPAATQLADIQLKRGDASSANKTLQNALLDNPGPDTLWLGIKIARALDDKNSEASYALQLRQQYPNSEQTQLLLSNQR